MSWLLRLLALLVFAVLAYVWLRRGLMRLRGERREAAGALAVFERDRVRLAEAFLAAGRAAEAGRSERWHSCQLAEDRPLLARDLATAELVALAGVSVEGVPGGGTAVFHWRGGRWTTEGRLVEGFDPEQTLERYRDTLEPL